ncbi:hypothetical protein Mpt1_c03800 [Candidatus Methanoplasma termitum]|uniref:DUF3788 domain-containing protein n=1 Tax=Candidatus Methanoplasma termitum TaxID=1577791 RepID=A0A0A7LB22_9ARCH|nr:DUF3788 family protein [Candidatus Methanoplasma termitum]AIZ56274.1 hypothetical protein Mpt1_c03800 [Candidatus Methanoplasma termitum]
MYERLLDKSIIPNEATIAEHIGPESRRRLNDFENDLRSNHLLSRELKFPFGNNYGWGYKYSHRSAHLCYVFFEKGAFTVTLRIGDKHVPLIEDILPSMLPKTKDLWRDRYPCGEHGGWIHYRILTDNEVGDVVKLVKIRKKPVA